MEVGNVGHHLVLWNMTASDQLLDGRGQYLIQHIFR